MSEPLLGNTPVTMAILQKCLAPFHHKLAHNIIFGSLYLIIMLVVSHVNLLQIHVSTYAENDC